MACCLIKSNTRIASGCEDHAIACAEHLLGNCMRSKSSSPTEASRPSAISSSRGSSHAPALLPSPPILHVRLLLLRLALPTPPAFLEGLSPPLLAVLLLDPHIMPRTEIHRDRVFEVYSMEHLTSTVDTEIGPFALKYRNCVPLGPLGRVLLFSLCPQLPVQDINA